MSAVGYRDGPGGGFTASCERFDTVLAFLHDAHAAGLSHSQLEDRLDVEGRELLRQLFHDHLDLRAVRESRVEVTDAEGGWVGPGSRPGTPTGWAPSSVRWR